MTQALVSAAPGQTLGASAGDKDHISRERKPERLGVVFSSKGKDLRQAIPLEDSMTSQTRRLDANPPTREPLWGSNHIQTVADTWRGIHCLLTFLVKKIKAFLLYSFHLVKKENTGSPEWQNGMLKCSVEYLLR